MEEDLIPVTDLRQFVYCPRIPYFARVLKAKPEPTKKMSLGKKLHERLHKIPSPNGPQGTYPSGFSVPVTSHRLGLTGIVDCISEENGEIVPYELKTGKAADQAIYQPHHVQLAAYAILLEEARGKKIDHGFIITGRTRSLDYAPIDEDARNLVFQSLASLKKMLLSETFPNPTPLVARCRDCEFWKICRRS
jgi:CRISPR-associated exonuclease Cas4